VGVFPGGRIFARGGGVENGLRLEGKGGTTTNNLDAGYGETGGFGGGHLSGLLGKGAIGNRAQESWVAPRRTM